MYFQKVFLKQEKMNWDIIDFNSLNQRQKISERRLQYLTKYRWYGLPWSPELPEVANMLLVLTLLCHF